MTFSRGGAIDIGIDPVSNFGSPNSDSKETCPDTVVREESIALTLSACSAATRPWSKDLCSGDKQRRNECRCRRVRLRCRQD